jgi:hypothetical protein
VILPRYTLNTSVEEWSAGTEVDVLGGFTDPEGEFLTVHPLCADLEDSFDVHIDKVTVRRNRTDDVHGPNRKERRKDDPIVEARRDTWIASNQ